MKKITISIVFLLSILYTLFGSTSCSKNYKDMMPGEIRLKENFYRNEEKIKDTHITTDDGVTTITAMETHALWRAIILKAEKGFENNADGSSILYSSPLEAEEAFYAQIQNSTNHFITQYPHKHKAILDALSKAKVELYAHYVWCEHSDEFVKLKFHIDSKNLLPAETFETN